jgi:hypothetical protein
VRLQPFLSQSVRQILPIFYDKPDNADHSPQLWQTADQWRKATPVDSCPYATMSISSKRDGWEVVLDHPGRMSIKFDGR